MNISQVPSRTPTIVIRGVFHIHHKLMSGNCSYDNTLQDRKRLSQVLKINLRTAASHLNDL